MIPSHQQGDELERHLRRAADVLAKMPKDPGALARLESHSQAEAVVDGTQGALAQRVAKLEEFKEHVATKAWVLGGALSGLGVGAGIATLILRAAHREAGAGRARAGRTKKRQKG